MTPEVEAAITTLEKWIEQRQTASFVPAIVEAIKVLIAAVKKC